jgi:hypothetical protein
MAAAADPNAAAFLAIGLSEALVTATLKNAKLTAALIGCIQESGCATGPDADSNAANLLYSTAGKFKVNIKAMESERGALCKLIAEK